MFCAGEVDRPMFVTSNPPLFVLVKCILLSKDSTQLVLFTLAKQFLEGTQKDKKLNTGHQAYRYSLNWLV
jgi:hypothetical protein